MVKLTPSYSYHVGSIKYTKSYFRQQKFRTKHPLCETTVPKCPKGALY